MQAEYDFSHGVRSKPRTASGGGDGMTGTEQNIAIAESCGVDIEPVINPKKGWSLTEAEIPPLHHRPQRNARGSFTPRDEQYIRG